MLNLRRRLHALLVRLAKKLKPSSCYFGDHVQGPYTPGLEPWTSEPFLTSACLVCKKRFDKKLLNEETKRKIANDLMASLFNAANETDLLTVRKAPNTPTVVLIGGVVRPDGVELARQARSLLQMDVHKLVHQSLKARVNKMMYQDSKGDNDLVAGKLGLWFEDVLKKTYEEIAKIE